MRRRIPALAALLLAAALTVTGCSGADDSGSDSSVANEGAGGKGAAQAQEDKAQAAPAETTNPSAAPQGGRLKLAPAALIRTATVTVRATNVTGTVDKARTAVEAAGGYVSNESTESDDGSEHAVITLKVPADAYDETLDEIVELGDKLMTRQVKVQDVTDEVVDVDSRVKSARASVDRVRRLMDQATKLTDIVSLEGELSTRQSNLEALLAQQASLKDRTGLGTITLEIFEPGKAPKPKADDDPTILSALDAGWDAFVGTLRWIGVVLAATLPFAALAALLWLAWRHLRRYFPTRTPNPPPSPTAWTNPTATNPTPEDETK